MGSVIALLVLSAALTGCNSARFVETTADGGVVAIPCNSNSWPCYHRDRAEALIRQRCPNGYDIIREEETVMGTLAHTNSQTNTREKPALVLGGANQSSGMKNGQGDRDSLAFGGIAIPLGETEQKTEQTTTYRDLKEWRIHYRAR
jgi:hypothetical protein